MCGLFRKKTNKSKHSFQDVSNIRNNPNNPATLLKEATAKKKAGDLDNAIIILRKAYREIEKGDTIYTAKTFLRLPLYLQEANRNDEAWREFNLLLINGYPGQLKSPGLFHMDRSEIYDKMRLFLQREGKTKSAVRFGILSYISWAIGLYEQKRYDELKQHSSKINIENELKKLLKKAKKEELLSNISEIVEKEINSIPNVNVNVLSKNIDRIILR